MQRPIKNVFWRTKNRRGGGEHLAKYDFISHLSSADLHYGLTVSGVVPHLPHPFPHSPTPSPTPSLHPKKKKVIKVNFCLARQDLFWLLAGPYYR